MKELKDSIFVAMVGTDALPKAKLMSVFILIPAILFYSFLVDRLRKPHLLYFYCGLYAIGGFVLAYLLGHDTMGLANTTVSYNRYFGWFFYFFYEGYSPFVVSLLWAIANSITEPAFARQGYAIMAAGGKLGGAFSALLCCYLFSCATLPFFGLMTDVTRHQLAIFISSMFLCLVPVMFAVMSRFMTEKQWHGYEAAYKLEKEQQEPVGIWSGIQMFFKQPYVLGIFFFIFFYEVINVVLNYHRIVSAHHAATTLSEFSCALFGSIFWVNFSSFILSFFGANALFRLLGVRRCLMVVPLLTGFFLFIGLIHYTVGTLLTVFVIIRAINYGISYPLRESLYIPTTKDIKFKSKSWIDSFGSKFSKGGGSIINCLMPIVPQGASRIGGALVQAPLFALLTAVWFLVAYLMGRRYGKAIAQNEVIGSDAAVTK